MVGEGQEREAIRGAVKSDRLHLPGGDREIGSVLGAFDAL
jgi:hypothetical protein